MLYIYILIIYTNYKCVVLMELQNHKGIISDKCKSLFTSLNYIRNCSFNTFKFYGKKETLNFKWRKFYVFIICWAGMTFWRLYHHFNGETGLICPEYIIHIWSPVDLFLWLPVDCVKEHTRNTMRLPPCLWAMTVQLFYVWIGRVTVAALGCICYARCAFNHVFLDRNLHSS